MNHRPRKPILVRAKPAWRRPAKVFVLRRWRLSRQFQRDLGLVFPFSFVKFGARRVQSLLVRWVAIRGRLLGRVLSQGRLKSQRKDERNEQDCDDRNKQYRSRTVLPRLSSTGLVPTKSQQRTEKYDGKTNSKMSLRFEDTRARARKMHQSRDRA